MEYTVRPATRTDIDALIQIFTGPRATAGTLQIPYESPDARRRRMEEPQPGLYSLVACTPEGEVVGNIGLHVNQRPRRSDRSLAWDVLCDDY